MIFWLIIILMLLASIGILFPHFRKKGRLALIIFFPAIACSLYFLSGRYLPFKQHQLIQEKLARAQADIRQYGQPKTLIHQLEETIKNHPEDAKAWYFLGKLYFSSGELEKASMALKKARAIEPNQVEFEMLSKQIEKAQ